MQKCFVLCLVIVLCVDFVLCSPLVGRSSGVGGSGSGKGVSGRRGYIGPQTGNETTRTQMQKKPGLSAWGIITLIMFIVLIGFGGYYGYMCYPFICKKERHYDVMDAASSSTSASTPTTRSAEFEKMDPSEFDGNNMFRYK
ncbi:hypothetical protein DMENIID0001_161200 [Sergentomyia squamirostris]